MVCSPFLASMRRVLTRRQIAVQGGLAGAIPVVLGRVGAPLTGVTSSQLTQELRCHVWNPDGKVGGESPVDRSGECLFAPDKLSNRLFTKTGRGLTQRVGRIGAAAAEEGERDEDGEGEGSCGRKPGNARRR